MMFFDTVVYSVRQKFLYMTIRKKPKKCCVENCIWQHSTDTKFDSKP